MKDGILLIDKSAGVTSRKVDNLVQHLFHTKRVGHLGTLDPFATGLLLVAVNSATKFLPFLPDEEKEYEGELILNRKTNTGDVDGEVIAEENKPFPSKEETLLAAQKMLGESEQLPPMASAIKINGVPLYQSFREGKEIERKARKIKVFSFDILATFPEDQAIIFRTKVSKGTYIRTLGETFASYMGRTGYLNQLRRTKIGNISLKSAQKLEEITENSLLNPLDFLPYPRVEVNDSLLDAVRNGRKVTLFSKEKRIVFTKDNTVLAIYEKEENCSSYSCLRGF